MTDPFLIPVPQKFANDPELAPYFNLLQKVLHDLTVIRGSAISDESVTSYSPHSSGAVAVVSEAATDLDTTAAALDTLVDEVTTLQGQVNAVLAQLRQDGTIKT